jgi:hypothetical protein
LQHEFGWIVLLSIVLLKSNWLNLVELGCFQMNGIGEIHLI